VIEPLLPGPRRRKDNRGRPWASNRAGFEGILGILQTGAAWRFLPDEFPAPSTCWRGLKPWEDEDLWLEAWRALRGALEGEGLRQWDETFLDGSFAAAKKGALRWVKPSGARARSGWYWSTGKVFPWEFGWKVPLRQKLSLRKPRSRKSAYRDRGAVRGQSRSG
jgi:transposase